ncbi:N-acetylmuramoyl-L-alanine amidase [Fictibacillus phosphorivorans]|nr:N-acetylmuramoyl-L-alanine amidase [Fictibacillus phosphorivorans]
MSYSITYDYIKLGNARPGTKLDGPFFGVAHDTGNPGTSARSNRNYFNNQQPSASAHVFIDDKEILVIIPLDEKAYHVQYGTRLDNVRFGRESNDAAIGVELCWGGGINFQEAYKRYVWFWGYLCKRYNWRPQEKIASHKQLDPGRRTDPDNALNRYGITFNQFLKDVENSISNQTIPTQAPQPTPGTSNTVLKNGSTGQRVLDLQNKLKRAGYTLLADGIYGPNTEKAVRAFQNKYKLAVDGVAGPNTIEKLDAVLKPSTKPTKPVAPIPSNSNGSAVVPYPGYVIKRGTTDRANVSRIQRALNIAADGNFGPQTESAVKAYQKRKGLTVDGIVGQATWNTLF